MNVHIQRRRRISAIPPLRSARKCCSVAGVRSCRTRSVARKAALITNVPASSAIAVPGPATAIRTPASAGPSTIPKFWAMPISAFACWRCSRPATCGISPPAAGRKPASKAP